jgi:hypothetical protein
VAFLLDKAFFEVICPDMSVLNPPCWVSGRNLGDSFLLKTSNNKK